MLLGEVKFIHQAPPKPVDGVALGRFPQRGFLLGAIGERVTDSMAFDAVGLGHQESGAIARAGPFDGLPRRLVHCQHIIAVHRNAGHAQCLGLQFQPLHGDEGPAGAELGVLVLFTQVNDRQLPKSSHVAGLHQDALIAGTIAEETHDHLIGTAHIGGIGSASGQADATTDNAVSAQDAQIEIGNVHRAALALAIAGGLAQQFGHHQSRVAALSQAMPMAAMRAGDVVVPAQGRTRADSHRFLSSVGVSGTAQHVLHEQHARRLVKAADQPHAVVHVRKLSTVEIH